MDNGNGGQKDDWNYWRKVANQQGANIGMDGKPQADASSDTSQTMTDAEKRQQTATEIARKKVLEAYKMSPGDYKSPSETSPAPTINVEDWRKYHSAWQDYYQKYYGEYYGKAARDYVARERLKMEREQAERMRKEADGGGAQTPDPAIDVEEVQDDFREKIRKKAEKRAKKMRKSRHFIPITLGITILVIGILIQYNQVIVGNVMAYMSPGNSEVNDITAIDPTITTAVHENPTLIIPKINVEVPVTFGAGNSVSEMATAMLDSVAHYSIPGASAEPGQIGNYVVSGHSAGNIAWHGQYKFIFSGLTRLTNDDLIYMDYNGTRYTYKVTGSRTVEPTNVASLREIAAENSGKPMITLITCTPLGTSKYRLLVYGEQVYPSYDNASSAAQATEEEEKQEISMPANEDTPFEAFWKWLTGSE